jgi:hypothetical protein
MSGYVCESWIIRDMRLENLGYGVNVYLLPNCVGCGVFSMQFSLGIIVNAATNTLFCARILSLSLSPQ